MKQVQLASLALVCRQFRTCSDRLALRQMNCQILRNFRTLRQKRRERCLIDFIDGKAGDGMEVVFRLYSGQQAVLAEKIAGGEARDFHIAALHRHHAVLDHHQAFERPAFSDNFGADGKAARRRRGCKPIALFLAEIGENRDRVDQVLRRCDGVLRVGPVRVFMSRLPAGKASCTPFALQCR